MGKWSGASAKAGRSGDGSLIRSLARHSPSVRGGYTSQVRYAPVRSSSRVRNPLMGNVGPKGVVFLTMLALLLTLIMATGILKLMTRGCVFGGLTVGVGKTPPEERPAR